MKPMLKMFLLSCLTAIAAPQHKMQRTQMSNGFVIPKEGFVPTAQAAISIAEAVLVPVYGEQVVTSERPFKAVLSEGVWIIRGSVPCDHPPAGAECPGGVAEVRISKRVGSIIYMMHSM